MHPSGLFLCNNKIKYGTMYEIKLVNPRGNQLWIFIGRTDAEAQAQAPILWLPYMKSQLIGKRLGCWERLRAGREGGDRGWDDWTASPIQWTWSWTNSRRWWGTGRPGMLQSMGSQAVRHELMTEQQQIFADWLNWLLQPQLFKTQNNWEQVQ